MSTSSGIDCGPGQGIATLVFLMTIVASDPVPFDLVLLRQFKQTLPEVTVGNRFFLGIFPTTLHPAVDPLGHALFDIFRVRGQLNPAGPA